MSRLEEIKQYAGYTEFDLSGDKATPQSVVLTVEHFEWLIEQAERAEDLEIYADSYKREAYSSNKRVEELEKENHKLNFEIGSYSRQVSELAHAIGVNIADLKIVATRMCKGNK